MIKRFAILLLAIMLFWAPQHLSAQSTITEIESMAVEIWPDYDDTAVLVLLTGFLPANASSPVTLTIPIPENADVNAVAYITAENSMTDQDVEYELEDNKLALTTSHPGFRIEFYIPYTADGLDREFSYTWQSMETAVNDMRVLVQEPLAVSELTTIPFTPPNGTPSNDGLTYRTILAQTVAANEPFTVNVAYTMSSPDLTANLLNSQTAVTEPESPAPPPTTSTPSTTTSTNPNWPLILAGLGFFLIVIAGVWQIATKRASRKPAKPKTKRQQNSHTTKAKFCHECGSKLKSSDKFCRDCGTAVKQK